MFLEVERHIRKSRAGRASNEHLERFLAVVPEFLLNICFYFKLLNNNLAIVPAEDFQLPAIGNTWTLAAIDLLQMSHDL